MKEITQRDPLTDVDVAAYTSFSIHEDLKKATQAAVPVVALRFSQSRSELHTRMPGEWA